MAFSSSADRILGRWVLGVLLAVGLALALLGLINRLVYGPTGPVRAYFSALQEGRGGAALGILGASAPEGAGAALLDGQGLRQASAGLEGLDFSQVEFVEGDRARVTASYRLDGREGQTVFEVQKVGSHWGVFDHWQLRAPESLPLVEVSVGSAQAATLNGVKVPVEGSGSSFAVLYPASVTLSYESVLLRAESESLLVQGPQDSGQGLGLVLEPSEAARTQVQQQVRAWLDACATQDSLYPSACPFEYDFSGRVDGAVAWSVLAYPETELSFEKGQWALKAGQGKAQLVFTELDLLTGERRQVKREVPFKVAGRLSQEDEALVFRPTA